MDLFNYTVLASFSSGILSIEEYFSISVCRNAKYTDNFFFLFGNNFITHNVEEKAHNVDTRIM